MIKVGSGVFKVLLKGQRDLLEYRWEVFNQVNSSFNNNGNDKLQQGTDWPQLIFADIGKPQLIADGFLFTEGPVWNHTEGFLLFSDIAGNTIYRLTLPRQIEVYQQPSHNANGLAYDLKGRLLAAEHGSRSVTRQLSAGSWETIAASYQGRHLHSPNDIAVRSDGMIYFTDPPFGLENRLPELDFMGLYRISPQGELILTAQFSQYPNGLVFSPDERTMYVALTAADKVMAFTVNSDGSITNPRDFAAVSYPDGMAIDQAGNVYIAGWQGVAIYDQQAGYIGTIVTELPPANCAFAGSEGKLLIITARSALYQVEVPIPG